MYAYMLIYIICIRIFCACSEPVSRNRHSSQQIRMCVNVYVCIYVCVYVCTCMCVFVRTSMCVFMFRRWTTLSARWVCVKKWATPGVKLLLFVSSVTYIWHRFVCMCGYHALQYTATHCNTLYSIYRFTCICLYLYMHMYVCIYICIYVCIYKCIYIRLYNYIYLHANIHMYIYIIYTFIYTYKYAHTIHLRVPMWHLHKNTYIYVYANEWRQINFALANRLFLTRSVTYTSIYKYVYMPTVYTYLYLCYIHTK